MDIFTVELASAGFEQASTLILRSTSEYFTYTTVASMTGRGRGSWESQSSEGKSKPSMVADTNCNPTDERLMGYCAMLMPSAKEISPSPTMFFVDVLSLVCYYM